MGKKDSRTYPVRTDVMRAIMGNRNISQGELARAVSMSKKAIQNILNKVNEPFEDNLVKIAAALGVKWLTLVEGYDGQPEEVNEGGGVATKTTVDLVLDLRSSTGMTEEKAKNLLMAKLSKTIGIADIFRVTFLRDDDEN